MTIQNFHEYLIKTFGNKTKNIFELTENDIYLNHIKIKEHNLNITNIHQFDKCTQDCKARKCRQDIPFWNNSIKKKVMIIAQDAGKGCEDNGINCVFSLQDLILDEAEYKRTKYYELFKGIFGGDEFKNSIYFTDIIKCAFSTDRSIKLKDCDCRNAIFDEITIVNPEIIILMGSPAEKAFIEIFNTKNKSLIEIENKMDILKQINSNKNSSLNYKEFEFERNEFERLKIVFSIPHFAGNLRISKEFRPDFNQFKIRCLTKISNKIKELKQVEWETT